MSIFPYSKDMVQQTENLITVPAERRSVVDKAYHRLCKTIVDTIQVVADSSKSPDVMMFENFHHFYGKMVMVVLGFCVTVFMTLFTIYIDDLSRLKLDALKEFRTLAQEKYRTHLALYVNGVLGHPLENLSVSPFVCLWWR